MKNVGIICEYNPLHGGHKYMIESLKARGAERVICLMSGNAVQRGDFAILPKEYRALSALKVGADAVFELPFPYSAGGAEFFASAGVDILSRLGVDTIAFGSETGNIEILRELADKSLDFTPSADKSIGTATDYFSSLGDLLSNDILGIEYLKAGKRIAPDMNFVTVKREGAGYHGEAECGAYPSATEIRRAILADDLDKYSDLQLPPESRESIYKALEYDAPVLMKNIESAILAFWRSCDAEKISVCAECGGGVAQRLASSAKEASSLEKMMTLAATKRYTDSRLRRAMLFGMIGVTMSDLKSRVPFVNLLAANSKGIEFVSRVKDIEVVSKPSKIPDDEASARQCELGCRLDSIYTLAMKMPQPAGHFLKQSPIVVKD